jgi:ERCC4-type nuclease
MTMEMGEGGVGFGLSKESREARPTPPPNIQLPIICDTREFRSRVPEVLQKLGDPIIEMELEVGDYIVGEVAVSRKSADDYVGSLTSGHLQEEVFQLLTNYKTSILIVEGSIEDTLMFRNLKRNAYLSSLAGIPIKKPQGFDSSSISIIPVATSTDTAWILHYIRQKILNGEVRLSPIPKIAKATETETVERRQMLPLLAIPGIGEVRAEKLIKHFKSARNVFNAPLDELKKVVGEKLGTRIYNFAREEVKE